MNNIDKNIEILKNITTKVKMWSFSDDDKEISGLILELEKIVRKDISKFYSVYLSDMSLATKLIITARTYSSNKNLVINIVSTLGNMMRRYKLCFSDELFDFFFELKDIKKINYYVSLFIVHFPQFKLNDVRWDYIISMIEIAPRTKSERNFYIEVKRIIMSGEIIPLYYRNKIIEQFNLLLKQEDINDVYKNEYMDILNKIVNRHSIGD